MNHPYIDTRFKADRPLREPTTLRGVLPALAMVAVGAAAVLIWSDELPGTRDDAVASAKPLSMTVPLWLTPEPPAPTHAAMPLTSTVALPENPEDWSDELPQSSAEEEPYELSSAWPSSADAAARSGAEQPIELSSAWPSSSDAAARSGQDPSVPAASTVAFPENLEEPAPTF